uniref:Pre-glycoprotein polyprotein GP complex n=3 Tax=Junin mammarenavirus TaxID=2169991 RepID=Q642U8_JUNIN|nr:glycoprotein [Mammarenavirus juninense]AEB32436.1 glycoprotein precursor [Mammarenavirus juninense]AEB32440.1 glycoprotein precursor [Mammarenavirus juninense]BAT62126.1 glycoprotein precursor [synthetic construct]BCZ08083.1 pre-glycoprotein polyprotein [Mammarenavirus sp.]
MGQFISFMQEIPTFLQEALNIALVAVSLIAIIKGIVNLYKSGLFQFFVFLALAGRSCTEEAFKIGLHTEFQTVSFSMVGLFSNNPHDLPLLCTLNKSHLYIKGGNASFQISFDDIAVLLPQYDVIIQHPADMSWCSKSDDQIWLSQWFMNAVGHDWHLDPPFLCRNRAKTEGFIFQVNTSKTGVNGNYAKKFKTGMHHLYREYPDPCLNGKLCLMKAQPTSWPLQCPLDHVNTLHFLTRGKNIQLPRRSLKAFFSWSLTDSSGKDTPGGYCLEEWMLVAAKMKCFGNTAVAKCNLNHDSEFCDMLRLFDYNKNAIKTLNDETKKQVNLMGQTINALISDNLLMKNKIRELMSVPYCNYTKFWYVNHTLSGQHSLPRCWLIKNNSYLNISDFRNDWILESDFLISEMLSKEYSDRQGKTPLTLVDICIWSTVFFTASLFLHLVGIPSHRHIRGEACPLPHRLNSLGGCRCGKYPNLKKPTVWRRGH